MKKSDLLLIAAIVASAFLLALFFGLRPGGSAEYVYVEVDGTIVETLPLGRDVVYDIPGIGGTNRLVIEDGIARISDADCPDRICVKMGKLTETNMLTCLPHRVIVYLGGDPE